MERHITLPLTEELAQSLHAGDTVLKSSGVTMAELMEQIQAQQRTGR